MRKRRANKDRLSLRTSAGNLGLASATLSKGKIGAMRYILPISNRMIRITTTSPRPPLGP